jgi:hypothetical protein
MRKKIKGFQDCETTSILKYLEISLDSFDPWKNRVYKTDDNEGRMSEPSMGWKY